MRESQNAYHRFTVAPSEIKAWNGYYKPETSLTNISAISK